MTYLPQTAIIENLLSQINQIITLLHYYQITISKTY